MGRRGQKRRRGGCGLLCNRLSEILGGIIVSTDSGSYVEIFVIQGPGDFYREVL